MKSLFEQMGGTYTQQGDYFLPNLKLPSEEERPVDVCGQRRLRYLRELYTNLKTSGRLHSHLADVEEQANALFLRLVKDYATSEGVTEQLKAEEPMEWVRMRADDSSDGSCFLHTILQNDLKTNARCVHGSTYLR